MRRLLDKLTLSVVPFRSAIKALFIFKIKYTPRRIWNVVKIVTSMYLSRLLRRPVVWGLPPLLMVEPTNICNLKCPMCPAVVGKRVLAKGQIELQQYKKLLDEVGPYIFQVQLWNQGEPFISKTFLDQVRYAKDKGLMTITSTNGHFIRNDEEACAVVRSGLDQLIISMDGTNQESYEKYRIGGNYQQVIDALGYISRAKDELNSKTPLLELQFIIFKHNQNEIDTLVALAKRNKVNRLSIKMAMVYTPDQAETYLDETQKEQLYAIDGDKVKRKQKVPNWCKRLWLNSTVNWDGTVVPCCFDVDSDFVFANVFEEGVSFRETWKNAQYMSFRRTVLKNRAAIDMCSNCTEGIPEPYAKIVEMDRF